MVQLTYYLFYSNILILLMLSYVLMCLCKLAYKLAALPFDGIIALCMHVFPSIAPKYNRV